jgi:RNase H-like domain found in reverse transcriptase
MAFDNFEKAIIKITFKAQPDFRKDLVITTNCSNKVFGAILYQVNNNGKDEMQLFSTKS